MSFPLLSSLCVISILALCLTLGLPLLLCSLAQHVFVDFNKKHCSGIQHPDIHNRDKQKIMCLWRATSLDFQTDCHTPVFVRNIKCVYAISTMLLTIYSETFCISANVNFLNAE